MKKLFYFIFIFLFIGCSHRIIKPNFNNRNIEYLNSKIIKTAKTFLKTRYKYGGLTKKGIDCSGLVYMSYKLNGIKIQRTEKQQYKLGKKISRKKIRRGDIIFFDIYKKHKPTHIGIYLGYNRFIHAGFSHGVIIENLNIRYFKKRFFGAKRFLF